MRRVGRHAPGSRRDEAWPAARSGLAIAKRERDRDGRADSDDHDGRRDGPLADHQLSTRSFSTPMRSISTSSESPATSGPTPSGVPVRITSPGSRVIIRLT